MNRRALLTAVAAAAAALAFALGAAAFGPTLADSGDAEPAEPQPSDVPPSAAGGATSGSSGSGSPPDGVDATCTGCPSLDVNSLVAARLPGIDPALLAVVLALAVVILGAAGLRTDESDPATATDPTDGDGRRRAASTGGSDSLPDLDAPPTNEVYRAWRTTIGAIDVPRPEATTPREYARRAREADLPHDAVDRLTDCFEAVRYGGADPTDELERRARAAARRIDDSGAERVATSDGTRSATNGGSRSATSDGTHSATNGGSRSATNGGGGPVTGEGTRSGGEE